MGMPGQHSNVKSAKHSSKLTKEQKYIDKKEKNYYLSVACYPQYTHEIPGTHSYPVKSILVKLSS